jgi:hypothetical protein
MRTQHVLAGWLGAALVAAASFAHATPSMTVPVGARPMGMGGAFVGLADDANAVYWNPAGLPRLQRQEFTGSYIPNHFFSGMLTAYGAATIPMGENQAIGADYFNQSHSDETLDWAGTIIRGSYGAAISRVLSIGLSAKYVAPVSTKYSGTEVADATGIGFDAGAMVDAGELVSVFDGLRFGFALRDVGGTSYAFKDTDVADKYEQSWAVGASYRGIDNLTIATDLDDRVHVGLEYSILGMLALRGGFQRDVRGYGSDMLFSGGVGLQYKGLKFDYAYETHPSLYPTHYLSLSFAYNPSFITIKDATVRPAPLFRALYRHYESQPEFVDITLKNTSQEPLPVSVGIEVPTMMREGRAHVEDYLLPPQSTETVTLGVTMDDSLLLRESSAYDNLIQPEVFVTYEQEREIKRVVKQLPSLYVLGRNKMTWEDPRRIATFVTPEHSDVIEFGNRAITEFRQRRDDVFDRCKALGTAMIMFDAVGKYGVSYNPDQTTPFYKIASDTAHMRTIFDTIKFPTETFQSKLGDCDDVTVLFSSLLEQQNIPTALLDVFDPVWGHVYMMFDTGLTPDEAMQTGLFADEREFVVWADSAADNPQVHAWVPVETTMYGHTFMDAWKAGVEEYHEKKARNYIRPWSVTQGRQLFQAGNVAPYSVAFPDVDEVRQLLELDIQQFRGRLELAPLEGPITADKLYDRAVEFTERAQYEQAIDAFTRALDMDPELVDAYNGRGVARNYFGGQVRYRSDDPALRRQQAEDLWRAAIEDFRAALRIDEREPGFWINMLISYQLLNDTEEVRRVRDRAVEIDDGLAPILDDMLQGAE